MDSETFRAAGHAMIDFIAEYLIEAGKEPVLARVRPGEVLADLQSSQPHPPESGEAWAAIWSDVERVIMPGITHWQSPHFYAYFPANNSFPSILGELLSAGLGVNGMLWATSPSATELEIHVLNWLVEALALPSHFRNAGVIQDTASSATLCALLCAREQAVGWQGNEVGLSSLGPLTIYTSDQAHSSVEKAATIAGIGRGNVRQVATDERTLAMRPEKLAETIAADRAAGRKPIFVSATMGTTSSMACDPLQAIGEICRQEGLWLHVDGAMAGTALVCPEHRAMAEGLDLADSFCFNPHKWMFTNFDLDAFWVVNPERLVRTMSILPEYLKTQIGSETINFRDWHIPLGRRFRALKLWFVLRHYGLCGLRHHVREHISLAVELEQLVRDDQRFELAAPRHLSLVCFRLKGPDHLTVRLRDEINTGGMMYLTHTKIGGRTTLRMCIAQSQTTRKHIQEAWDEIRRKADRVLMSETT